MDTNPLKTAIGSTRKILGAVQKNDLDKATPCESWKIRDVINHVVGNTSWVAGAVNVGEAGPRPDDDLASGDFVAAYDKGGAAALEAFGDAADDTMVKLPFGEFPAGMFIGIVTTDQFVHGWDIAKALGQDTDLEPELAAQLLAGSRAAIADAFRGPDGQAPFGAEREASTGASAADQLAAFLGRKL
jgi:uncharacterized protein (TIGR03086 family)